MSLRHIKKHFLKETLLARDGPLCQWAIINPGHDGRWAGNYYYMYVIRVDSREWQQKAGGGYQFAINVYTFSKPRR
jgi:hypothetical protein